MSLEKAFDRLLRGDESALDAHLEKVSINVLLDGTKARVHCHHLALNGNGEPRVVDLAELVNVAVLEYAIDREQIRKAQEVDAKENVVRRVPALYNKAQRLFTTLENSGEGGEVLLYLLIQHFLRVPQIICKMQLKTSSSVHVHGIDGLHAKLDSSTGTLALYWGESKLYADIGAGIRECLNSLSPYLKRDALFEGNRDIHLLRDNIANRIGDPQIEEALVKYLDPDDPSYNKVEFRGACLVGFDFKHYKDGAAWAKKEALVRTIEKQLKSWHGALLSQTKGKNLENVEIEVFLIPFPAVEDFRKAILAARGNVS